MSFFCPRTPSRIPHYIWLYLLRLLFVLTVSQIFIVFEGLLSTGLVFCEIFLILGLSDVFLMIRLRLWGLGRKTTEVKYHSHDNMSGLPAINMT